MAKRRMKKKQQQYNNLTEEGKIDTENKKKNIQKRK